MSPARGMISGFLTQICDLGLRVYSLGLYQHSPKTAGPPHNAEVSGSQSARMYLKTGLIGS